MFTNQWKRLFDDTSASELQESHSDTQRCLFDGWLDIGEAAFTTSSAAGGGVFFVEAAFCVAFCNNFTTFKSASDMIAYSNGFISSSSSKVAAWSDSESSARTASYEGFLPSVSSELLGSSKRLQYRSHARWRGVRISSSWTEHVLGSAWARILITCGCAAHPAAMWSGVRPRQSWAETSSGRRRIIWAMISAGGSCRQQAWRRVIPLNWSFDWDRMSDTKWKIVSLLRAICWKTDHLFEPMTPRSVAIFLRRLWSIVVEDVMVVNSR